MIASIHDLRYQALRAQLICMRKASGLTQVQVAERLGVGQSFVSKIERGEAYVEVFFYLDWCAVCGVLAADAIGELSHRPPAPKMGADGMADNQLK